MTHKHRSAKQSVSTLLVALGLTLVFSVVEAVIGKWTGSLALMADAGHMVTDSASLGLAALAAWLALRPPSRLHTYGLGRIEVLIALINALAMLAVVIGIAIGAWQRFHAPQAIDGLMVSGVAVVGLIINAVVAWWLHRSEQTLNIRGALLHVTGDLLGSVAAIISGLVIWLTGWTPIDPLLSVLIGGLILISSFRLLRESLHALLDGVPFAFMLEEVGEKLATQNGVKEVHNLHLWSLSSQRTALTAHIVINDLSAWPEVLSRLQHAAAKLGIEHTTFQPEISNSCDCTNLFNEGNQNE